MKYRCLHTLFEEQARSTPDSVVLVYKEHSLTYAQLNARANQLACTLQHLGVGADIRVGLCLKRSIDLVIAILGVLKAGGAYVPLDPAYPDERLAFLFADSKLSFLLTHENLATSLPSSPIPTLRLDHDWSQIALSPAHNCISTVTPEHLAYIIYTSGSTGQPKGCMVPHRSIPGFMEENRLMSLSCPLIHLQHSSLSWDALTLELWPALLYGGCCVLFPGEHLDLKELAMIIQDQGVQTLWLTASLFNTIIDTAPQILQGVKQILSGGEVLSVSHIRQALHALPETQIINGYGPSECTVFATGWTIETPLDAGYSALPIGYPIGDRRVYLVDTHLCPVPFGMPGEIVIGGPAVPRGYINQPGLTAERFVPDPFSQEPGARLYRTGDLARYRADGALEYLGRLDNQVKWRGFRIELEEIEVALQQHPFIKEAAVLLREDMPDKKRLVAYITCNWNFLHTHEQGKALSTQWLQQWQALYDETYSQPSSHASTLNITGWNSSYTGYPLSEDEMVEWINATVTRIRDLQPSKVLEIGCGTGLLLFRLAPECTMYYGTDISKMALEGIQQHIQADPIRYAQVNLLQQPAHDFTQLTDKHFEVIILNSVVQYFPGLDYLVQVLEQALSILKPGGSIFLGDIRSLPLLEIFHTSVLLQQAPDTLSVEQARRQIHQQLAHEEELIIDPAFFFWLQKQIPQLSRVRILPKRGQIHNEMLLFRYDVVLQIHNTEVKTNKDTQQEATGWQKWQKQPLTPQTLKHLLRTEAPACIRLENVPNGRLQTALLAAKVLATAQLTETIAEVRARIKQQREELLSVPDLEEWWNVEKEFPYKIEMSWARHDQQGTYELLLQHTGSKASTQQSMDGIDPEEEFPTPPVDEYRPWYSYASIPMKAQVKYHFIPLLQVFLSQRLPDYMIPATFILLDHLPLTAHGKVDRGALPSSDQLQLEFDERFVTPTTQIEKMLAQIWGDLLNIEQISIHDNFFTLGGDSLTAIYMVSLAQQNGMNLTAKDILHYPTIAELATFIDAH